MPRRAVAPDTGATCAITDDILSPILQESMAHPTERRLPHPHLLPP